MEVWFEKKLREVRAEAKREGRTDFRKKLLEAYKINPWKRIHSTNSATVQPLYNGI